MEPSLATSASPLNPLSAIQSPFASALSSLDTKHLLVIIFGIAFLVWLIYTLVVLYHWMKYGHQSRFAVPSFLFHIVVSGALFLAALSAF